MTVRVRTGIAYVNDPLTGQERYRAAVQLTEMDAAGVEVEGERTIFNTLHATKAAALAEAREAAALVLGTMDEQGMHVRCYKCRHAHALGAICPLCGCCETLDVEGRGGMPS